MKESQFIKANSTTWEKLETYSEIINKKGIKSLSSQEIKDFLKVFRLSSHHLAYAKTYYPETSVIDYLNSLVAAAHSNVYAVKKVSPDVLVRYIAYEFPKLLRKYKWFILSSFGFFAVGFIISLLLVLSNEGNFKMFLPQTLAEGIKSGKSGGGEWNYPLMSSYIMVNNITISLKAFVMGITLGIGTVYVLFFNGTMVGALTGMVYLHGKPINYWSLILPHGVIELTAIFISGGAGLIIAKNMLVPGEYSRKDALINGTKKAVSLVTGVVLMLIIAGIIEGFFTPLKTSETIKLSFAAITAIILGVYFAVPYIIKDKSYK
jgi:uncharacterized membrane protein SpoIIM required for sporulation